jgi:hypothetical protein
VAIATIIPYAQCSDRRDVLKLLAQRAEADVHHQLSPTALGPSLPSAAGRSCRSRSDFDSRSYGYAKLSDLITATTVFETDRRSPREAGHHLRVERSGG